MTLRLTDPVSYAEPIDHWPIPRASKYIASPDLERLCRDIERYSRRRVSGRSYLIAGHRGVGKTSLAMRAVKIVATRVMTESVLQTSSYLDGGPFQRPLLVKLEGPSMLAETRVRAEMATKPPKKAPDKPAPEKEGADAGEDAEEDERQAPCEDQGDARAHAALVQITIGLYRALAAEAATGFRAHALCSADQPPGDQLERAAQLALDLDGGAEAGRLREYWAALGRLDKGVFWPESSDDSFAMHGMHDQGLREITALATAAQAFQVCTGRIRYETKVKDSLVRQRISELKASSDIREALNRLGTLGLGALTGVSILASVNSGGAALAGGLAVWLLGSITLNRSEKRTRTNDRHIDYSFIRDTSPETLGRDLPVVIERVREAGLAPVFVIDELDKVPDAPKALSDIVGKLKHLIADYGFFCFLVNRDCFDAIESKVRNHSYPSEHTLFGARMLLRPDPAATLSYLLDLIEFDPAEPQAGQARAAFALTAMHAAQLNFTDLMRQLSRSQHGKPNTIGTISELVAQRKLIIASFQLAIDETLRNALVVERMDDDPVFAQLAMDTVYYPARCLRKGVFIIDPSAEALRDHLVQRMTQDGGRDTPLKDGDAAEAAIVFPLSDADLGRLHTALVDMLRTLADLDTLRIRLGQRNASGLEGDPLPGDYRLASIPPVDVAGVCEELVDGRFRFLFGADGESLRRDPTVLTRNDKARAKQLIAYARELKSLISESGTSLDELARTPLLESVAASTIDEAIAELETAIRLNEANAEVFQHLSTLDRLAAEIRRNDEPLGALLLIVASLRRDVPEAELILPSITRLIRFQSPPNRWIKGREQAPNHPVAHEEKKLRSWRKEFGKWLLPAPGIGNHLGSGIAPYMMVTEPLRRYFRSASKPPLLEVTYSMLIDAVRGTLPASALTSDMRRMTVDDWTSLALDACPAPQQEGAQAPYWMLIAALRGLGFGREALLALADTDLGPSLIDSGFVVETQGMTSEACFDLAMEFAEDAPPRRAGILVIQDAETGFGASPPNRKVPALVVDVLQYQGYIQVFEWLTALGIIVGRTVGADSVNEIDL